MEILCQKKKKNSILPKKEMKKEETQLLNITDRINLQELSWKLNKGNENKNTPNQRFFESNISKEKKSKNLENLKSRNLIQYMYNLIKPHTKISKSKDMQVLRLCVV